MSLKLHSPELRALLSQRAKEMAPLKRKRRPNGANAQWIEDHADYDGEECLIWPFSRLATGYAGSTCKPGMNPYQYMCELVNGPRPIRNWQAAHKCNNGHLGCVHPKHLYWATPSQNALDMVECGKSRLGTKGRHWKRNNVTTS